MPLLKSFFDLFKKKEKGPSIIDKVWMHQAAKEQACIQMAKKNPHLTFVAWSSTTYEHFRNLLKDKQLSVELLLIHNTLPNRMQGKEVIFLEHHLYRQKELELLKAWKAKEAIFLNSFDDPVFTFFQAAPIKKLMERMGMEENEVMEHSMISKSLERAQQKIETTGLPEDCPSSVKEWLEAIG